ncbi:ATP dependent DNA ligase domain-containing protein [Zopfochytrium polystomum]|nr:ATP dependent DNA ligase domain-containing protein [Zopfochytrium polystomum]
MKASPPPDEFRDGDAGATDKKVDPASPTHALTGSAASHISFRRFAQLLDSIQRDQKPLVKKRRLEKFIQIFRRTASAPNPPDFFPILRLLLPHLDKNRATYGLKDKLLATIYVDVLSLRGSDVAERLIHWRRPTAGSRAVGDFGEVLFEILRDRTAASTVGAAKDLTVSAVNSKLDALNAAETGAERQSIIQFFATNCSATEQKWLSRIILKEMKMGITEHSIFQVWHPEAEDLYNVTSNLAKVAHDLNDLSVSLKTNDVVLNTPFKPMLSKSAKSISSIERLMKHKVFWIETKLDGERMQLHKERNSYRWFSRNAKDYTHLYGESKDEKFAKCIHQCISPSIETCILDGELMSFIPETGEFEGFGALKTAANRLIADGENAVSRPCFVVFDIVFVNGRSLMESPLRDRHALLLKAIRPRPTFLEILTHMEGSTNAQVVEALDLRMLNHDEGIIIKNPDSPYTLNDRSGDWLKLKPDYIDSLGDDIDLVVVAGFFGTGRRSGRLSHFMCAIIDDSFTSNSSNSQPEPSQERGSAIQFMTLCKFGTGYKLSEIEAIAQENLGNWSDYNPRRPPAWLIHPLDSKEKPDRVVIDPHKSRVVSVKAAELVKSEQYAAGWTLRFPRFVGLRPDKSPADAMKQSELAAYIERNRGRMQSRRLMDDVEEEAEDEDGEDDTQRRRRRKQSALAAGGAGGHRAGARSIAATVAMEYRAAAAPVIKENEIFRGLEICVIVGGLVLSSEEAGGACTDGDLKHFLEKEILRCGGTCVQNPKAGKTDLVIADRTIVRVSNQIGKFDIVKSRWVLDCVRLKTRIELQPRHALFPTEKLRERFRESNDVFGDSFTEPCTINGLKELFSNASFSSRKRGPAEEPPTVHEAIMKRQRQLRTILAVEERYFGENDQNIALSDKLFRRCCVYIDSGTTILVDPAMVEPGKEHLLPSGVEVTTSNEPMVQESLNERPDAPLSHRYSMTLAGILVRSHGGQVANIFGPWTTHVLIPDDDFGSDATDGLLRRRRLKKGKERAMGATEWSDRDSDAVVPEPVNGLTYRRRMFDESEGGSSARRHLFMQLILQYQHRHSHRPHVVTRSWVNSCIEKGSIHNL